MIWGFSVSRAKALGVHRATLTVTLQRVPETTAKLSREQKGRFVAVCWTAQMFKHFEDPKRGYVADWPDLPAWQQETVADIFEVIEKS